MLIDVSWCMGASNSSIPFVFNNDLWPLAHTLVGNAAFNVSGRVRVTV
jgi:hypothetical protein